MNQQCENVTESGIKPETFPLLEGLSTIGAILVRLPDSHILALYALALHPILHNADLKDERKLILHGINFNLEQYLRERETGGNKGCWFKKFFQPLLLPVSLSLYQFMVEVLL